MRTNKMLERRKIMYHYTSEEGFNGILKSSSIWLTSAHYMNDPTDCRWVFKLLREKIELLSNPKEKEALKNFVLHCEINYPIPYIASFSLVNNDVSQWDRYASHGCGIALEFKRESFGEEKLPIHNILRTHNLTHHNVEYREEIHAAFINEMTEMVLNAFRVSFEGEREFEIVKAYCCAMVNQHSMIFKCPSYKSEQEVRVIHTPFRFSGELGSYEDGGCVGDLQVRASSYSDNTPYFVLEFPKNALKSILVGPKNTNIEVVRNFVREYGYDVPVYHSEVPFR